MLVSWTRPPWLRPPPRRQWSAAAGGSPQVIGFFTEPVKAPASEMPTVLDGPGGRRFGARCLIERFIQRSHLVLSPDLLLA
jgi:hypothetical protein